LKLILKVLHWIVNIKESLTELLKKDVDDNLVCQIEPIYLAAENGALKLVELLLDTSFDWKSEDFQGNEKYILF